MKFETSSNQNSHGSTRASFAELEELSSRLKQSEALKSHFLSNIRNEINNPLSSALGITAYLMNGREVNLDQLKRKARLLHNELFNLNFQMQNIFTAADLEGGEFAVEATSLNIVSIVNDVLQSFQFKADQKNISVSTDVRTKDTRFSSDPYKLHLIISNLLSNAIEYTRPGGNVDLCCVCSEEALFVTISDQGEGIPDAYRSQIFQRFHQLDHGSTKKHGGHGLGLSVIKELVEMMRGEIGVESHEGVGTRFTVIIPSAKAQNDNSVQSESYNEFMFGNDQVL